LETWTRISNLCSKADGADHPSFIRWPSRVPHAKLPKDFDDIFPGTIDTFFVPVPGTRERYSELLDAMTNSQARRITAFKLIQRLAVDATPAGASFSLLKRALVSPGRAMVGGKPFSAGGDVAAGTRRPPVQAIEKH
jgi:hypothetical protein